MVNPSTSPAFVGYGMKTEWDGNARLQSSCFENITVKEQPNVKEAQVKNNTWRYLSELGGVTLKAVLLTRDDSPMPML